MNKRGQVKVVMGLGIFLIVIIVMFILSGFTPSIKNILDSQRGGENLNCPGVSDFNQTAYDAQTSVEKGVYRPVCFVTGIGWVYFVLSIVVALFVWGWKKFNK